MGVAAQWASKAGGTAGKVLGGLADYATNFLLNPKTWTGRTMFGLPGNLGTGNMWNWAARLALPGALIGGMATFDAATTTLNRMSGYGRQDPFGTPQSPYAESPISFSNGGNFSSSHLQATGSTVFAMHNLRKG